MRVVRAVHDSVRRPHGRAWLYDLSRDQANALIASTASMPARRTSYPNKNFRRPGEFEILLTLSNSGNIHSVLAGLFTHCCVAFRLTYLQYACELSNLHSAHNHLVILHANYAALPLIQPR